MKKKSGRDIPDFSRHPTNAKDSKTPMRGDSKAEHAPAPRTTPKAAAKTPNAGRRGT